MKILPSLCRWTLKNVDGEEDASRLPALSKAVLLDRGRLPHHVLVDIFSGESFGGILSCMAALISGDIGAGDPGASPFANGPPERAQPCYRLSAEGPCRGLEFRPPELSRVLHVLAEGRIWASPLAQQPVSQYVDAGASLFANVPPARTQPCYRL